MKKTPRSERYMAFVRQHASCLAWDGPSDPVHRDMVEGAEATVAHHVRMGGHGGIGIKPSDYRTVPLTDEEHRLLHQMGERVFWAGYGVDPEDVIISLLAAFVGSAVLPEVTLNKRLVIAQLEDLAAEKR